MTGDWQARFKEIFGIKWPKLLESLGQTVYMLGWALLIGAVIGLGLALLLVLCRKGGLRQNRAVHAVVNAYVNIVRSMPFIITLVFVFPLTRLIVGKTYGSTAMLVPLVIFMEGAPLVGFSIAYFFAIAYSTISLYSYGISKDVERVEEAEEVVNQEESAEKSTEENIDGGQQES